jgi:two-component system cell cycle response regulator DivK
MRRVLIVEDHPSHMELAAYILERGGYKVLQATSAEDGIALARKESPALILMDLRLPGMDGVEAIRVLRGDPETSNIKIIAVTSYRDGYGEQPLRIAGADALIRKPYHYEHFLGTLKAVLGEISTPDNAPR